MDLPRPYTIRESSHRILNGISAAKLAALGEALAMPPETTVLDLASGKGELLSTWARDHRIRGTGVDLSTVFTDAARARADELGVADRVTFVHGDASTYVSEESVDVAACCGATWIGDGVAGTIALLERSLRPGGLMLIGEPFWRMTPPDEQTVQGCHASSAGDHHLLPGLLQEFADLGWDVVEMVLGDQGDWDRYFAAQWLNLRRWLDANPDDELHDTLRAELTAAPVRYARYLREYLGWGIFALMKR